ncbi:MAG: eCIS core domain-containing protein [Pseudomonadales bacterium]
MTMLYAPQTKHIDRSTALLAGHILQRKCACGQHKSASCPCETCSKKKSSANEIPASVYDELHSAGQPLDSATRSFMEQHLTQTLVNAPISSAQRGVAASSTASNLSLGAADSIYEREADQVADALPSSPHLHFASSREQTKPYTQLDLSSVRIHTGNKAAESSNAINARAYTVGSDVVFGAHQYSPSTFSGRHLLAHELTHVVQQSANAQVSRVIQRAGCAGRTGRNCNGARCTTPAGRRGMCQWGGRKFGCNCRDQSGDAPTPVNLPYWITVLLGAAATAAVIACFASGACEFGLIVGGLGTAAAAAVIALLNAAGIRDSGGGSA